VQFYYLHSVGLVVQDRTVAGGLDYSGRFTCSLLRES